MSFARVLAAELTMRAVFAQLEGELKVRIIAAARNAKDAGYAMRLTLRAFFDACLEDR